MPSNCSFLYGLMPQSSIGKFWGLLPLARAVFSLNSQFDCNTTYYPQTLHWSQAIHTRLGHMVWSSSMQLQVSQILHFQAILKIDFTSPLALICDLWPHEHVKVPSFLLINRVWFESDFNFSNKLNFTFWVFWSYLTSWPLTLVHDPLVHDLWPHEHTKGPILYQ